MTVQIAHLYATACCAIVFFQIALIAGAPLGQYTQGGRVHGRLDRKGRLTALFSIPILVFQGLAILSAAGFPGMGWHRWTGWAALAVSTVTMILNLITPSKKERAVWGPITILMAGAAGYVMISTI